MGESPSALLRTGDAELVARAWQGDEATFELGGLVEEPVTLTYQEILALPKSIADV